jgi:hypothetical protein
MCGSAVPRRGTVPLRSQRAKLIRANLYERPTAKDKLAIQISIDTVAVHVVELSVTGAKTEVGCWRLGISSAADDIIYCCELSPSGDDFSEDY